MSANVLEVRDFSLSFRTGQGDVHPLRNISMIVPRGEIVGVAGESGSGKSTLALAVMRLLAANATITSGSIGFSGIELMDLSEEAMRALRGSRISMVFQDPMTSLNPVRSIGQQMADIQYRDGATSSQQKRQIAIAALQRVGIPDAAGQLARYPFQFSGGMRQRIAIAMSLLLKPELLIADEVTTALDVTLEAQILHLLRGLKAEINGAILFISHNLGAIAEICDRVVVLYAGEVVEAGLTSDIFARPQHPYTQALIACDPARIAETTRNLPVIPGDVPNLRHVPSACIFAPRCGLAVARCRIERPELRAVGHEHSARCHLVAGTTA